MDSKTIRKIDDLIERSFDFWYELREKYGLGNDPISVTFYPIDAFADFKEEIQESLLTQKNSRCNSVISCTYSDGIISHVTGAVYWSYESLYRLLIECELDYDRTFESMKFTLRHEMGHILDYKKRFIGQNIQSWNKYNEDSVVQNKLMPTLRRNAKYENRLRWYLIFNSLPAEKNANNEVGITEQDIIDDFKRTHRK